MAPPSTVERTEIESRRVHRVYEVLARFYDDGFDWALGPGRRRAVARLPLQPGDRVLEVGVGTGLSLPSYPPRVHVTGIDISEAMLDQAQERLDRLGRDGVDLRLMDARDLTYPAATFDHVLAPYVISVVPEPERVMAEIARVLRPGGTAIVVNHFVSRNRILAAFERSLTPASRWIGFRLDEPIERVTAAPGFELSGIERVNLFGLWRLVELRRTARGSAAEPLVQ
jgi:phosphatidylethanolamine/phosphatidyl-N-methylethanolamine N-methyltransferase